MSINVKVAAYLQCYIDGKESLQVEGSTVRQCLENLIVKFPEMKGMLFDEKGGLLDYISVFTSRDVAFEDQIDNPVKDGDVLNILYVISGG